MVKKIKVVEEKPEEVLEKDLKSLSTLCDMAKHVIDKYEDPIVSTILELAFVTDLITPNGVKLDEIIDEDIKNSFYEYCLKVGDKLRERGII